MPADSQHSVDADGLVEARAAALNYLARREHACAELLAKLVHRGVAPDLAAEVVQQLRRENLVSDQRFAEAYVRSRAGRLFGPHRIRAELRQRQVSDALIEGALAEYGPDWQAAADQWARKRARPPLDRRQQASIYRGGKSRGFSHDQIMRALENLRREA